MGWGDNPIPDDGEKGVVVDEMLLDVVSAVLVVSFPS